MALEGSWTQGHVVEGKDVDEDAAIAGVGLLFVAECGCVAVAQLGMAVAIEGVGVDGLEEIGVGELLGCYLLELVVVFARHSHVDVVVPGDVAMVTYGAKEGSCFCPDCEIIFVTHSK